MLWRVCWHYTQHREDARDCVQEAMLKAWRALPQYRGDCSLETWLYRIAASCCLDLLRKQRRTPAASAEQLAEEGFDPPDPSPQPEEELQRRDERAELQNALAALPAADERLLDSVNALLDELELDWAANRSRNGAGCC